MRAQNASPGERMELKLLGGGGGGGGKINLETLPARAGSLMLKL